MTGSDAGTAVNQASDRDCDRYIFC